MTQFARASELARHFEQLSAAATSTTTQKSPVIRRNTSSPLTTRVLIAYDNSITVTPATTSCTVDTRNKREVGVRRARTSVNDHQPTVKPVQFYRQSSDKTASWGTATTSQSEPARHGLQFVHRTKSVVLVPQAGRRQASVDMEKTCLLYTSPSPRDS